MPVAVVTGATGCIGRNLVDVLLADRWDVIALHRRSSDITRLAGLPLELRTVNLHNRRSVLAAVPKRPDAVFHCAANLSHHKADYQAQWKDNVLATRNMVAASITRKARRFILTSTGAVTGPSKGGYATTKRQAEGEVGGIEHAILRLPIVIGRYDWNNYSRLFRMRLPFALPGYVSVLDARDAAAAHLPATGLQEIGGHRTTWLDLFQRIARCSGVKPPTHTLPRWWLLVAAYAMSVQRRPILTPDLVRLLDCGPSAAATPGARSINEMLADCYKWLNSEARA